MRQITIELTRQISMPLALISMEEILLSRNTRNQYTIQIDTQQISDALHGINHNSVDLAVERFWGRLVNLVMNKFAN